jgi:hypothetical protein
MLELLNKVASENSFAVNKKRELTAGKSGAWVIVADCTGDFSGEYIIKIEKNCNTNEREKYDKARQDGAFNGKIPEIRFSYKEEDCSILIMTIGGGSAIDCSPLVGATRQFSQAYGLLGDILKPHEIQYGKELETIHTVLTKNLGHRLTKKGNILKNFTKSCPNLSQDDSYFMIHEEQFPNPLFVALNDMATEEKNRIVYAPVHGDCHMGNIYVRGSKDATVKDIHLIDLSFYTSDGLLFFDHAYLELSALLNKKDSIGTKRWLIVARELAGRDATENKDIDLDDKGWVNAIWEGRSATCRWIEREFTDRRDTFYKQFLVAHVAAALNFMNKREDEKASNGLNQEKYRLCLLWGAVFLKRYLEVINANLPLKPHIPALDSTTKTVAPYEEKLWKEADFFATGLNILIIDDAFRKIPSDEMVHIFKVKWQLVLDFSNSPIPSELLGSTAQDYTQEWFAKKKPDEEQDIGCWIFLNGRVDISDAPPCDHFHEWRRKYYSKIEDRLKSIIYTLSPEHIRILGNISEENTNKLSEILTLFDTRFFEKIQCIILDVPKDANLPQYIKIARLNFVNIPSILDNTGWQGSDTPAFISLPCREGSERATVNLNKQDLQRLSKNLTIVSRAMYNATPIGYQPGLDFLRGGLVQWADISMNIPIARNNFEKKKEEIKKALESMSNHTVNLLHGPSAGGSTLSRQLGWEFKDSYPTVIVEKYTPLLYEDFRYIFQLTSLPLLVVMESAVVCESDRETLLQQLREDNTTAVFLWTNRAYTQDRTVMPTALDDNEAKKFFTAYNEYCLNSDQTKKLKQITERKNYKERSPFFYGLYTFHKDYLGIDTAIDKIFAEGPKVRNALTYLALVSYFSSNGFPLIEFKELFPEVMGNENVAINDNPLFFISHDFIKISHVLISEAILERVARKEKSWYSDLTRFSEGLIEKLANLTSTGSERVKNIIETIFFSRDISTTLEQDSVLIEGRITYKNRYSPLIMKIRSTDLERKIIEKICRSWKNEPHYAVHYARHLLYEEPKMIGKAYGLLRSISFTPKGQATSAIFQMLGMCNRFKINSLLLEPREYGEILPELVEIFEEAIDFFEEATALRNNSEYGYVASLQLCRDTIRGLQTKTGKKIDQLMAGREYSFAQKVFTVGEEILLDIERMQKLSERARSTIKEWRLFFESVERVLYNLRAAAKTGDNAVSRRLLCSAYLNKCGRLWFTIPQSELSTIVKAMEQNIQSSELNRYDLFTWFNAYRHMNNCDNQIIIERMLEWEKYTTNKAEVAYYLYIYRFIQYLNSGKTSGYAKEVLSWLTICKQQRSLGDRVWSYEWLQGSATFGYKSVNYAEIRSQDIDPVKLIQNTPTNMEEKLSFFPHVSGTVVDYKGPQSAKLDLGYGIKVHFVPQQIILRSHEGCAASMIISFSYDGLRGWAPELEHS